MITKEKMPWCFLKLSQLILKGNEWRSVWRICLWILGLKGLKLHIVIKPLNKKNKHNKFLIMLRRYCINVHCKFGARQKWEPAGRIGDFGNFWNGFVKSPRLIVLNILIDWVQFVLKNCEILHSVRGLYDK